MTEPGRDQLRWIGARDQTSPTLGLPVLATLRRTTLYRAVADGDKYSHHSYIASHGGVLYATWSNHLCDEDAPGQHVCGRVSTDGGASWEPHVELFPALDNVKPRAEQDGMRDRVVIANGFAVTKSVLYAIAECHLLGELREIAPPPGITPVADARGGASWSRPGLGRLARAIGATDGPLVAAKGRNPGGEGHDARFAAGPIFWLVEEPPALGAGFPTYPAACDAAVAETAAAVNAYLREPEHWPSWEFVNGTGYAWSTDGHRLCEPTEAWRLPNGGLARIWRDASKGSACQYVQFGEAEQWSRPGRAAFPDAYSRAAAGNLPDGSAYVINNPGRTRDPLIISLAVDGLNFDRHAVIAYDAPPRRFEGMSKNPGFQYPHAAVLGDNLYVIYSVNKEEVEVASIPIASLQALPSAAAR